jgi:hypothetical protein
MEDNKKAIIGKQKDLKLLKDNYGMFHCSELIVFRLRPVESIESTDILARCLARFHESP